MWNQIPKHQRTVAVYLHYFTPEKTFIRNGKLIKQKSKYRKWTNEDIKIIVENYLMLTDREIFTAFFPESSINDVRNIIKACGKKGLIIRCKKRKSTN